jgi:hypothetical protein
MENYKRKSCSAFSAKNVGGIDLSLVQASLFYEIVPMKKVPSFIIDVPDIKLECLSLARLSGYSNTCR